MRILYHHRVASRDGQFVHIDEIIKGLEGLGHEVKVVSPKLSDHAEFGNSPGTLELFRENSPKWFSELVEFCYSFTAMVKLLYAIRTFKPDFVYERYNLLFISGALARKLLGVPLILEVNSPLFEERSATSGITLKRLTAWSQEFVWKSADAVLPVSAVLAENLFQAGVERHRVTVIHNGANPALLVEPTPSSRDLPILESLKGKLVIGFTGFVRPWHGLDRVLRFLATDKRGPWVMLLVGDGPDLERLKQVADQLGVSDRFIVTGVCQRDQIPAYIDKFDIAVQPDVVAYASPLKLFEYMAMSRAIIAPNRPNIREVLPERSMALLFDPDVESEFIEMLSTLCSDKRLRKSLGCEAQAHLIKQGFLWPENAKKIVEVFKTIN